MNKLSVIIPVYKVENYLNALNDCKGYLRSQLAKKLKARKMPELIFKHDEALEYGNKINDILASLNIKHEEDEE